MDLISEYIEKKLLVYIYFSIIIFLNGLASIISYYLQVRSILLRGFDQEIAQMIGKHLEDLGIKFLRECIPVELKKIEPEGVKVTLIFI